MNAQETLAAIDSLTAETRATLLTLWKAAMPNGGDFGFSTEAFQLWKKDNPEGSAQKFAGHYGALTSKALLYSDDEVEVNGKRLNESCYSFPEEVSSYLWSLEG